MAVNTGYWHLPFERSWIGRLLAKIYARLKGADASQSVGKEAATTENPSLVDDLSEARVMAVLNRDDVRILGRDYRFYPVTSRTMLSHPADREVGSLRLADDLTDAQSGLGPWPVGLPGFDLAGSLFLGDVSVREALREGVEAMRAAIAVHAEIEVKGQQRSDCLAAEVRTMSGRKVAGLLAEEGEDGTVVLGFCLRTNEPNNHNLPLGDSSLMIETGREFPRDLLLGRFLANLESMISLIEK